MYLYLHSWNSYSRTAATRALFDLRTLKSHEETRREADPRTEPHIDDDILSSQQATGGADMEEDE